MSGDKEVWQLVSRRSAGAEEGESQEDKSKSKRSKSKRAKSGCVHLLSDLSVGGLCLRSGGKVISAFPPLFTPDF